MKSRQMFQQYVSKNKNTSNKLVLSIF